MFGLRENSWILLAPMHSTCSSLLFWLKSIKKIQLNTDRCLGKRRIFLKFSQIIVMFLFDGRSGTTDGRFLKVCGVESEITPLNFLHFGILKTIDLCLVLWMELLSIYDFLTLFISHLENIDLLCNPTIPNVDLCFILQYQEISPLVSSEMSFKYWSTGKPTVADSSFPNFSFSLESLNRTISDKYCQLFLLRDRFTLFISKKIPKLWISIICSSVLSSKTAVPWKKWLAQLTV